MWLWPVKEMIGLVLYVFFILRTRNMSSRTPGGTRTPGWKHWTMLFQLQRITEIDNLGTVI
jgi:hypothetical protein